MGQFSVDINAFCKKAKGRVDEVVRTVVIDIGNSVINRSPVGNVSLWKHPYAPAGYVGGNFKANWQYGNIAGSGIPMTQLPDIDETGEVSKARIKNSIMAAEVSTVHYIVNNLPYAMALEHGHSTQSPPNAMVGLTVLEFQQYINSAVAGLK